MALTTYAELQTAIANWLNRTDLTTEIKDFIKLAEARFNRELRASQMIKRATALTSDQFVAMPTDWLEAKDMAIGDTRLSYITEDFLDDLRSRKISGKTRFYTIIGREFELFPTPTSDITLEMSYYAKIPSLSDTAVANWLLLEAPDLYLYGALQQATVFLMDDARLPTMAANATAIIQSMNTTSEKAATSGSPLVARINSNS